MVQNSQSGSCARNTILLILKHIIITVYTTSYIFASAMDTSSIAWPYVDFSMFAPGAPDPDDVQVKLLGEDILDKLQQFGFVLFRSTGLPQYRKVYTL